MKFTRQLFNTVCYSGGVLLLLLCSVNFKANGQQCSAAYSYAMDSLPGLVKFTNLSTVADTNLASYQWDFGDGNVNSSLEPYHTYAQEGAYVVTLSVFDSSCVNGNFFSATDTIMVCVQSCVWPGDVNKDGTVNNLDILPIGVHHNANGPIRGNPPNISFTPQLATDWPDTMIGNINLKHADCDGDGIIDSVDVDAIVANYGNIVPKASSGAAPCDPGSPPLYLQFDRDSVRGGDTLNIGIGLGDDIDSARNSYGLAFSVAFDSALVKPGMTQVTFTNSWLAGNNSINVVKKHPDRVDIGFSRIDHQQQTGAGTVANLIIVMVDDLGGTALLDFDLESNPILAVDGAGLDFDVCPQDNAVPVINDLASPPIQLAKQIKLFPVPADNHLTIKAQNLAMQRVTVTNMLGQALVTNQIPSQTNQYNLDLAGLESGFYLIKIDTDQGQAIKKFNVVH